MQTIAQNHSYNNNNSYSNNRTNRDYPPRRRIYRHHHNRNRNQRIQRPEERDWSDDDTRTDFSLQVTADRVDGDEENFSNSVDSGLETSIDNSSPLDAISSSTSTVSSNQETLSTETSPISDFAESSISVTRNETSAAAKVIFTATPNRRILDGTTPAEKEPSLSFQERLMQIANLNKTVITG